MISELDIEHIIEVGRGPDYILFTDNRPLDEDQPIIMWTEQGNKECRLGPVTKGQDASRAPIYLIED